MWDNIIVYTSRISNQVTVVRIIIYILFSLKNCFRLAFNFSGKCKYILLSKNVRTCNYLQRTCKYIPQGLSNNFPCSSPWFPMVCWLPLVILDYPWLSLVILGYPWLSLVILGYPWLSLVILSYP